ncbi:sporulation protein [Paenibacillus macquariensis subsp. defensor]|uniref:Sporulation lipoprotein, YhcN/YlaJ family n=2 Tax=Paenibacillus macquariensis TaxID=948756 RepID=A0ABY1K103_9BACL|nr:YhcN/YlaJ family sporulation lipoprotein [Paenibacillus macquariensis]OAB30112.1 sporulation protein [Paenibacillus macquariensis subsp. defensor]OAB32203.1 sporulation protein [Paenibacillus macquariensis subsp. macquariensis]SIR10166.1 sporulation lipoprotein, YhcN/YlaJ family [Paenibacillus macquariensis]
MRLCLCFLLTMSLLTSCGTANKNASPSPQNQNTNTLSIKSNANTGVKDQSVKSHLEALAERVPGVKKAHCVVIGNTAVVGIDVEGSLTRSRVGTIKYSVAEALSHDPRGLKSLVTADMDLSHRIAEIGNHIRQGHPVSGFTSELADIMGRIVPQLPEDVKTQQNSPATKSTKSTQKSHPSSHNQK